MRRSVLYVAHPLRPTEEEVAEWDFTPEPKTNAIDANLRRALRWLSWLRRSFPETTFIAPWISAVLAGADDSDPAQRDAGLLDDCAVVERCDGIVLCGGRISIGMRLESEHGRASGAGYPCQFRIYDLTRRGTEPPGVVAGVAFSQWWSQQVKEHP